jgi:putative intracellular protease/amidase
MTANLNVTNPARKKRVLSVASNPSTSMVTGWPVGFWWAELTHRYRTFTESGREIESRSPEGGALAAPGLGAPRATGAGGRLFCRLLGREWRRTRDSKSRAGGHGSARPAPRRARGGPAE